MNVIQTAREGSGSAEVSLFAFPPVFSYQQPIGVTSTMNGDDPYWWCSEDDGYYVEYYYTYFQVAGSDNSNGYDCEPYGTFAEVHGPDSFPGRAMQPAA